MAFLPVKFDGSCKPQSIDYLPAAAITPKVGMALFPDSDGQLAIATTGKVGYISLIEKSAAVTAGTLIPVLHVTKDMLFETVFSASASGIDPGDTVSVASDGLRATASANSSYHVEIVQKFGSSSGDKVRVRFV